MSVIGPINPATDYTSQGWLRPQDCNLVKFANVIDETTQAEDYPFAQRIAEQVPIYDANKMAALAGASRSALQAELAHALLDGPGIIVFSGAFDAAVIDAATVRFNDMIARQKDQGAAGGDHFARPGANDRVWRAQQKLAAVDAPAYVDYYANPIIELVSEAWLGPMYQVTSDINVVNPGGAAQNAHRDYHLGFMSTEQAARFPTHVHAYAARLTLQGAVAHCDMPLESGPTLYLPYSQRYAYGYLAAPREDFQQHFTAHHVQLPLGKGDAVFFNPALFHAAGTNRSADIKRMANLLQISSAFGRAMGALDRTRMCRDIYTELCRRQAAGQTAAVLRTARATAEGYGFPTNLDKDQPTAGLAPETQCELLVQAVAEGMSVETFETRLAAQVARRGID